MRIAMKMMDELVLEPLCLLDSLKPRVEFLWHTDSRGESTAVKRHQISRVIKDSVSNGHNRARGHQDDLFPDRSALIVTDVVDLVDYNSYIFWLLELRMRAPFGSLTA